MDHQGSIVAHSNSGGILTAQLAYDAFGIPDARNLDSFGYTGQLWLKDLGLYYYKARMYHPKLGRFMQTDPTGLESATVSLGMDPYSSSPISDAEKEAYKEAAGYLPGIGGAIGVADAVNHPTAGSVAGAAIGVVPGGKLAAKIANFVRTPASQRAFRNAVWKQNAEKFNGVNKCEGCGKDVEKGKKFEQGDSVSERRGEADHKERLADGGSNDAKENGQLLCNPCHVEKTAEENRK